MQTTQLDQLLKFLTETLQQGKDFTVEQAPQFVRELLMWRFYEAAIWAVCLCAVAVLLATLGASLLSELGFDDDARRIAKRIVRVAAALLAIMALGANGMTMVRIKVAPRVVVAESIRSMITNASR